MKYVIVKTEHGVIVQPIREQLLCLDLMVEWDYAKLNEEFKDKPINSYQLLQFNGSGFDTIEEGIEPNWEERFKSKSIDELLADEQSDLKII